jgi:prepilin-type N-terminal cleavage/methylation domain-containing protein
MMSINARRFGADSARVKRLLSSVRRRADVGDGGFSMVEMMVSIVVIAIVATASVAFFIENLQGVNSQRQHQEAVYLADQQLESIESLPVLKLVHGRPKSSVQALYSTAAATALGISAQDDVTSNSNWDSTATSLANVTVPLTSTQTVNNVAYNLTTFIDACYYSVSSGVCGPTSSASTNQEYRASIYETWTSPGTCKNGCSYSTRTLIDPTSDPTFNANITVPQVSITTPSNATVNTDNAYTDSCTTGAGTTAGTKVVVTGSNLKAGLRVKISPGGGSVSEISQVGTSELDFCLTSGDTPGVYTISVINTDGGNTPLSVTEAGNISQATGWDPTSKTLTLYGGGFETGTTLSAVPAGSATWTGYQVYNCSATTTAPCSAGGSADEVVITGFNPLANGATSGLTLTNPDSTITYPLKAPKMGTLSKSAVAVNQTTNLTISGATGFEDDPNSLMAVVTTGNGTASVTYGSASTATLTVSPTSTGTMTVYLYNDDGGKTNTFNITVDPKPTVTTATPNAVPVSTTKTVTVTGTGFLSGMTASSNNGTVSVSSVTSTSATLSVRASTTANDTITLTNTDGGTVSFSLSVDPLPSISSISPTTATHSTTTTFTVSGSNFVSGATVSVVYNGSTSSPSLTYVNSGQVRFAITLNSSRSGTNVSLKVTVTNPDGGVSSQYSTTVKQS